jgi:hypothetical protein
MSPSAKLAGERRHSSEPQSLIWQSPVHDQTASLLATGTPALGACGAPTFTLAHMELLHHWSTATGETTSRAPPLQRFWKTQATCVALQHGFLLSTLLAFAARHLARLRPQRRGHYDALAARLQGASLRVMSAGRLLLEMSKDTSEPLFLFSGLAWMNSMASLSSPDEKGVGEGQVLGECRDVIVSLRGVAAVVARAWSWLALGGLGPVLLPKLTWDYTRAPPTDDPLRDVEALILTVDDAEKRGLYTKIVKDLQVVFVRMHYLSKDSCFHPDLFQWPARLPARYVELLTDGEPEALVIFAHYAVLLSRESSVWWLQGKAESIISSVYSHLSPENRRWVEWPIQQVFWNKY